MGITFTRVRNYFPGREEITQIEGIMIADLAPTGPIQGVPIGRVCLLGEFADMGKAVKVNKTTGEVTTNLQLDFALSAIDFITKYGGFDSTIGKFGSDMGNGYVAVANKPWASASLLIAPINLCSQWATRYVRDLPTNKSATDATPIVPVSGAAIAAGREFRSSTNRVKVGTRVIFEGRAHYASGLDGTIIASAAAATQFITSAGGAFTTVVRPDGKTGVKVGDIVVLGSLNAATGSANLLVATAQTTYRVTVIDSATKLTLQRMDGADFEWAAGMASGAIVYRIHPAATADSGGECVLASATGYLVPARPLDATVNSATALTPTVSPLAGTGAQWDGLTGLKGFTHPTNNLTFTTNIQAPNRANSAELDALYVAAMDSTRGGDLASYIDIIIAARKSSTIRSALRAHALAATNDGLNRITLQSPELDELDATTILTSNTDPGAGALRDERRWVQWPGFITFVKEAVGISIATADGDTTTDGMLDTPSDEWMACILSNLPPERNPAQHSDPVPRVLANVLGFQRGAPTLTMAEYILAKANGVQMPRFAEGKVAFYSGVTTEIQQTARKPANRVRMFDFLSKSFANGLDSYAKEPLTDELKDQEQGVVVAFLEDLKSTNNPKRQRIKDYDVDIVSGNTPEQEALGIFVMMITVRMLATQDHLVLGLEVGQGAVVVKDAS